MRGKRERYRGGNEAAEALSVSFDLGECHFATDEGVTAERDIAARFNGIASLFNREFQAYVPSERGIVPTIIHPGAFTKTIQERNAADVKLLALHRDDWLPVGAAAQLSENQDGLGIAGFVADTALGIDVAKLMRLGVLRELSIGATPIKFDYETQDGKRVRHIREYRLHEVSFVMEGANHGSRVVEVMQRFDPEQIEAGDYDQLTAPIEALIEAHVGRVLSAKTQSSINDAIAACKGALSRLEALMPAAEPPSDSDEDQTALTARKERNRAATLRLLEIEQLLAA